MINELKDVVGSLTVGEIKLLIGIGSNQYFLQYFEILELMERDFRAIWLEITKINGNWQFKDVVLPKLFGEIFYNLKKQAEKINEIENHYFKNTLGNYCDYQENKEYLDHLDHVYLVYYLIEQIGKKFIPGYSRKLHQNFSHISLKKDLRIFKIRMENAISGLLENVRIFAHKEAEAVLVKYLQERLDYYCTFPMVLEQKDFINLKHDLLNRIYDPSYKKPAAVPNLDHFFFSLAINSEYHNGIMPRWIDKGISCYLFSKESITRSQYTAANQNYKIILFKDPKTPLINLNNYYYNPVEKSFETIFSELNLEEWFKDFINSEQMKEMLAREIFLVMANYFENRTKQQDLKDYETLQKFKTDEKEALETIFNKCYNKLFTYYGSIPERNIFIDYLFKNASESLYLLDSNIKELFLELIPNNAFEAYIVELSFLKEEERRTEEEE